MPDRRKRARPDPKPEKRIVNRSAGREKVLREGRCRICKRVDLPLTRHHLIPRSLRGSDVDENIVPLCGDGVRGCHGLIEARNEEACMKLRASLSKRELAHVIQRKGAQFLDNYYPEPNAE